MRASTNDISAILAARGVIVGRHHPELRGAIDWRVRTGELVALLPGIYAPAAVATSTSTRIAAAAAWDPDAGLTHEAAAAATFWPSPAVPVVRCVVRHARRPAGLRVLPGNLPAGLIWRRGPLRLTSPALTALDLCDTLGGDAIDQALRSRATTIDLMRQALALTPKRIGNPRRRQLLLDSRDVPWSEAERVLHGLLRGAGVVGWTANRPLRLGDLTVHPDIMFRRLRLVIEIDGRAFHSDPQVFESDRQRQNVLVLHGWRVLRLTWTMIQSDPDQVVAMVREAMATC